jgi:hypothetical protein
MCIHNLTPKEQLKVEIVALRQPANAKNEITCIRLIVAALLGLFVAFLL